MASNKVSVLKFVGTVSLGLLTGASYALSGIALPALLELPSASTATKAVRSARDKAAAHLNALAGVSGTAFLLAFVLSPRGFRHPYLLYTSLLVFGTRLTGYVTPVLFGTTSSSSASSLAAQRRAAAAAARREKQAARRMEASYEVLGETHSDEGISGEELDDELVNGEEVRGEVELLAKNQLVQAVIAGLGFAVSVVGIWGDGIYTLASETVVIDLV